jgi:hypothetical protein
MEANLLRRNIYCMVKLQYKTNKVMNSTERYFFQDEVLNKERHLESGDNPDERKGGKKQKRDKGDNKERDLEAGDNPAERGKNR